MPLHTDEELEALPEFDDLKKALRNSASVFRLRIYRHEDPDALARVTELRNLQVLTICMADVSRLLPRIGELPNLQKLTLQACSVPDFPMTVLQVCNLRSLSIGNCELKSLPEDIDRLVKLEELRLPQNRLSRLPESICRLAGLKILGLHFNQVEALPDAIGNLSQLKWLLVDCNQLTRLPDSTGALVQLDTLDVSHNDLTALPDSIARLGALEDLNIEGNPFQSLPAWLGGMAQIQTLTIEAEKRPMFMDWSYPHSTKPAQMELAEMGLFIEPGSPLYPILSASIDANGLAAASPAIVRVAREAIRIDSTVPDDYSSPGVSRLGGFPDLPDPSSFPKTDGLYWIFLAQLNLAELASLNRYLPRAGLLSFFVDSTESLNARVIFHCDDPATLTAVRHRGAEEMTAPDDDYTKRPHRVTFQRIFSLPYGLHKLPEEVEEEADDAYGQCRDAAGDGDHHLNGYTFTQHESPQQQAANELRGKPEEWVPLLQLGWDDKVGFCFWDAGTLTFTIHQEDLRRFDFSRVKVTLETS